MKQTNEQHPATDASSRRTCVAGRTVRLTLDRGSYQGAAPYYTVAYLKPSGNPQALRYTPFLERAEFLFDRFREDVTDPARFATPHPHEEETVIKIPTPKPGLTFDQACAWLRAADVADAAKDAADETQSTEPTPTVQEKN